MSLPNAESRYPTQDKAHATRRTVVVVVTCLALLAIAAPFLRKAYRKAREAHLKDRCRTNLELIAFACGNYRDKWKNKLPPAAVYDENGVPLHSWRCLLLPYLPQQLVYGRYDFDVAWNEGTNLNLLSPLDDAKGVDIPKKDITKIRQWFQCPCANTSNTDLHANFVMIVDRERQYTSEQIPRTHRTKSAYATRHAGDAVVIMEIHDSDIHWLEPRDLSISESLAIVEDSSGTGPHAGGRHVMNRQGKVEFLSDQQIVARLRSMQD